MNQKSQGAASEHLDQLRAEAEAFARNSRLLEIGQEACLDEQLHREAISHPRAFLEARGIPVPEGLTLTFFKRPPRSLPSPDWTPFIIELTNCRTVWVRVCDDSDPPKCEYREEEICFGWRIYPNPVQSGPIG